MTDNLHKRNLISSSNKYYEDINLFRGFAIFTIVWEHFLIMVKYLEGGWASNWLVLEDFRSAFIDDGSAFFVFISGFLFYSIFYKRGFDYKKLMISKIKKVFCPYFVVATAFLLYRNHFSLKGVDDAFILSSYMFSSFWYIPFIMVMFTVSPIFVNFIKLSDKYKIILFIVFAIVSFFIGRRNFNPFLSTIFWMSFYMLGILTAINYDKIVEKSVNDKLCVVFIAVLVSIAVMCLTGYPKKVYDFPTWELSFNRPSFMVFGKLSLCLAYLIFFGWLVKKNVFFINGVLKVLAKYSFSIFFLQQFFLFYLVRHNHREFFSSLNFWQTELVSLVVAIGVSVACILIAWAVKKLTGKYSRMVIGA